MITKDKKKTLLYTLFTVYLLVLSKLILLKFYNSSVIMDIINEWNPQRVLDNIKNSNLIPFVTSCMDRKNPEFLDLDLLRYHQKLIVYNIIAFVPFGFFLPLLKDKFPSFAKVTLATFLLSLSYESIQTISTFGRFDVDDIVLNTLGGMIGFGLVQLHFKIKNYMLTNFTS